MTSARLGRWITGSVLVSLSLCSIVVSLGAPGLGWALSAATLITACICSTLIGRKWLLTCLILTLVLLVTFGPLGVYDSSSSDADWVMAILTIGPISIGLVTLLLPFWRQRFGRASR